MTQKKRKRIVQYLILLGLLVGISGLSACSLGGTKAPAVLEVTSGTYVLEKGKNVSADQGYLSLNFSLKNTSGKTIEYLNNSCFKLYDDKGNQLSSTSVYATESSNFKTMANTDLLPDKTLKSTLVFQVDKGKAYELHFSAISDSGKKNKDVVVKVDTQQYEDPTSSLKDLAGDYVNAVFLGQGEVQSDLANDLDKSHQEFNTLFGQKFITSIAEMKSYYSPTDKEVASIVSSFEAANRSRGKVTYQVDEMLPDYAVVKITPTVLSFNDLDAEKMMNEWSQQNQGKYDDYEVALAASAKYLIQNISKKFTTAPVSEPSALPPGGEKLILKKDKSGHWLVDEKDSTDNTGFKYLQSDFMGGLSNY